MKSSDYPGNGEITLTRKAVLNLQNTQDWQALEMAKSDLYFLIKKRQAWLNKIK